MSYINCSRLTGLFFFGCLSATIASGDQILLKDGDRVTGSIVKKDGQTVTILSKSFGAVTLKWDDISTVTTDQPLNVILQGDRTVKATIQTQDGHIQVASPGATQTVGANEIVALRNDTEQRAYERFRRPGLLDLWTITGSLGIAGTKGNAQTFVFTTPLNFSRVSNTSKTTAYFNSIRSSASINGVSTQTASAVRGGWSYGHNLNTKVFLNGFNDYEYDKFQSLDLRVVAGGGVGIHAWASERGGLDIVGGGAWNRESFDPAPRPAFTRNSAEVYWGNDFSYKLTSKTKLVQGFRMFNNLSTSGQYRMNFDVGASTALTKWLDWTVSISDRYLSNPAPGRKSNDLLYTTGLGFSFSR
ncbi:MAG: DUF481 domain-containing protein [Bryobacteraceae bacterium]|nr:DUF481 domain-containing protein [Bryobacteraceae bacterium]